MSKRAKKCKDGVCKAGKYVKKRATDLWSILTTGLFCAVFIAAIFVWTLYTKWQGTYTETVGYLYYYLIEGFMLIYAGIYSYMHKDRPKGIFITWTTVIALSLIFAGFYVPIQNEWTGYLIPFALIFAAMGNIVSIFDKDKTTPQHMRLMFGSLLPIILSVVSMPTFKGAIAGAISAGAIQVAEVSSTNVFNVVWNTLMTSPLMQGMIAVMSVSSIALILGKARGIRGYGYYALGWVGVAGIPTLVLLGIIGGFVSDTTAITTLANVVFGGNMGIAQFAYMFEMAAITGVALAVTAAGVSLVESIG